MDRCGNADGTAGLPPRQRPHSLSQASRRARQDLLGENVSKARASGRRPGEGRAGRMVDQPFQKVPQVRDQGLASTTPCALLAEIGRKSASRQSKFKNSGTEGERRERLTRRELIGYTRAEAVTPSDFNIDRDIPGRTCIYGEDRNEKNFRKAGRQ